MKIKLFNRKVSTFVLAGLMLNLVASSIPLHAQQPKMSRAEIDKAIKTLQERINKMRRTRREIIIFSVGVGVVVGIPATIVAASFGIASLAALASGVAAGAAPMLGFMAVMVGVVGGAAWLAPIIAPIETALLHGLFRLEAITKTVWKLERLEKKYPGTLTQQDKTSIKQFKNLLKDPIVLAITKALHLKKVHKEIVSAAIFKNPDLITGIGSRKKAEKVVKKHLNWSWRVKNMKIVLDGYRAKKHQYEQIKKAHRVLSWKWSQANTKLIALKTNLKRFFIKKKYKSLTKKLAKMERFYDGIHQERFSCF